MFGVIKNLYAGYLLSIKSPTNPAKYITMLAIIARPVVLIIVAIRNASALIIEMENSLKNATAITWFNMFLSIILPFTNTTS